MVAAIPNKEEDDKWGHILVTAKKDYMILCAADQKTMPLPGCGKLSLLFSEIRAQICWGGGDDRQGGHMKVEGQLEKGRTASWPTPEGCSLGSRLRGVQIPGSPDAPGMGPSAVLLCWPRVIMQSDK